MWMSTSAHRIFLLALSLLAFGPLLPAAASACDCEIISVEDAFAASDAVFVGSLRGTASRSGPYPRGHDFVVERAWKGAQPGSVITLWETGSTCDSLGAHVESRGGRRQLVFALRATEGPLAGRHHGDYCNNPLFGADPAWNDVLAQVDAVAAGAAGPQPGPAVPAVQPQPPAAAPGVAPSPGPAPPEAPATARPASPSSAASSDCAASGSGRAAAPGVLAAPILAAWVLRRLRVRGQPRSR
jgi:hypothetical protein